MALSPMDGAAGWHELSTLPPGLRNLGNTCYLNSVLQALASSSHFTAFVFQRAAAVNQGTARLVAASANPFAATRWQRRALSSPGEDEAKQDSGTSLEDSRHAEAAPRGLLRVTPATAARAAKRAVADVVGRVAEAVLPALGRGLAQAVLWVTGYEPPPPTPTPPTPLHLAAPAAIPLASAACAPAAAAALAGGAMASHLRHLAACDSLLRLAPLIKALQPRYGPARSSAAAAAEEAAARAGLEVEEGESSRGAGPVDAGPLLAALRAVGPGGQVLQPGEQSDAAEALELLCDSLDSELASWHVLYGRWLEQPLYGSLADVNDAPEGRGGQAAAAPYDSPVGAAGDGGPGMATERTESLPNQGAASSPHLTTLTTLNPQPTASAAAESAAGLERGQAPGSPGEQEKTPVEEADGSEECEEESQRRYLSLPLPLPACRPPPSPLRGLRVSCSRCRACGNRSTVRVEPFWTLQLPLPPTPEPRRGHPSSTSGGGGGGPPALPHHRQLMAAAAMGPPRMALAAAAAAATAGGGGGGRPAGLTLADCLRAAVKAELVPGVECARCSLASALGALQPLLRRCAAAAGRPHAPAAPSSGSGGQDVAGGGSRDGELERGGGYAGGCSDAGGTGGCGASGGAGAGGAAGAELCAHASRLAALLAAPQPLPDLDLDLELGRLRRLAAVVSVALAVEAMGGGGGAAACRRDEAGAGVVEAEAEAEAAPELRPVRSAALRRNWVARPPPVLVLQLQRTVWDHVSGTTGKDGRHVAFPVVLPASELAAALGSPAPEAAGSEDGAVPTAVVGLGRQSGTSSSSSPPPPYVLVAVAVHYGGADSGHYLVYRRVPAAAAAAPCAPAAPTSASRSRSPETCSPSPDSGACGADASGAIAAGSGRGPGGLWLRVSDASVSVSSLAEALAQPAALLVYERRH